MKEFLKFFKKIVGLLGGKDTEMGDLKICPCCKRHFDNEELPDSPDSPDLELPISELPPPPLPGSSFSIQLQGDVKPSSSDYHYVDMFDNSKEEIGKLGETSTMVGYFSSQFEDWRPDASRFSEEDKIQGLGWPGEWWINPDSENVRAIMRDRFKLAHSKGFKFCDLDNIDIYANVDEITKEQCVDYVNFLSDTAREFGMRFSLKNALLIIDEVKDKVDMFCNEQCYDYNECGYYDLVHLNKPVFIISYEDSCPINLYPNSFTILKNLDLKDWERRCTQSP